MSETRAPKEVEVTHSVDRVPFFRCNLDDLSTWRKLPTLSALTTWEVTIVTFATKTAEKLEQRFGVLFYILSELRIRLCELLDHGLEELRLLHDDVAELRKLSTLGPCSCTRTCACGCT